MLPCFTITNTFFVLRVTRSWRRVKLFQISQRPTAIIEEEIVHFFLEFLL